MKCQVGEEERGKWVKSDGQQLKCLDGCQFLGLSLELSGLC